MSEKHAEVIRATLPVVGENIGAITGLFYTKLFDAAPVLERDVFNRSNQARGEQQKALAGSIANFATLLISDTDEDPRATIGRIAHKHASLGVSEAQYDVVHTFLFEAIVDVLGEAVTPEVAEAWDAVYWLLANALIDAEKQLYQDADVDADTVLRDVQVLEVVRRTDDVVSLVLDASGFQEPVPGQYLSIGVELPDGARQIRQYSIVDFGNGRIEVAVKRDKSDPLGEVSNFIHDHVAAGTTVVASPPFGDVALPEGDGRVFLLSKGIGNAPFVGILGGMVAQGRKNPVVVIHADSDGASHAFAETTVDLLDKLGGEHVFCYGEPGEAFARAIDERTFEDSDNVLICGSVDFVAATHKLLDVAGVPDSRIHYEVFGPDSWLRS
ncbi:globin domain-containing protein [Rhodococcus sp. ACT016]|uniref:globin domain-containing protein n=1 Tax=Rhodococcus sp. ACT016 TaxID=3134808 RepID=UPI003D295E7B